MFDSKILGEKTIYIACGDSAGHIYPALSLAEELTRSYRDKVNVALFTTHSQLTQALLKKSDFNFHALPFSRRASNAYPAGIMRFPFSRMKSDIKYFRDLIKSFLKSFEIVSRRTPDCFVGFGSYAAAPMFVAASLFRVPTLIHEQNVVMGRANRIMRHFATRIALSFPQTAEKSKKVVITGNPIRKHVLPNYSREHAIDLLGLDRNRFTILIIGGSQGSHRLNLVMVDVFANMERRLLDKIQAIHLCGESDLDELKKAYNGIDVLHRLYPFFQEMGIVYSAADISISRAGASCIFELCAHKIPSILVPYPFAGGHQIQNAKFLAEKGAAIVIEEDELSSSSMYRELLRLLEEKEMREALSRKVEDLLNVDAGQRLADEVISLTELGR